MASVYEAGPSSSSSTMYTNHRVPPPAAPFSYQRPLSRVRSPSPPVYPGYSSREPLPYDPYHSNRPPPPRVWPDREGAQVNQLSSSPDRSAKDRRDSRISSSSMAPPALGETTSRRAASMRTFEPSEGWKRRNSDQGPASYSPDAVRQHRRPSILQPSRPAPTSPEATNFTRQNYSRRSYDDNSSSAASSRAPSASYRRTSPPRGRVWTPRSSTRSPIRRSDTDSRSPSRKGSPSRPRRQSPGSRQPTYNSARLQPRSPSSSRSRGRTRSTSRGRSRRNTDRHRSRSYSARRRSPNSRRSSVSSGSRSDSIASSRASPPPVVPAKPESLPEQSTHQLKQEDTQDTLVPSTPLQMLDKDAPIPPQSPVAIHITEVESQPPSAPPDTNTSHTTNHIDEAIEVDEDAPPLPAVATDQMRESNPPNGEVDIMSIDIQEPMSSPRSQPDPDFPVVDISKTSDSLRDALRITVMTRILCDRQPRDQIVEPVLRSNLDLVPPLGESSNSSPDKLVEEYFQGAQIRSVVAQHDSSTSHKLADTFQKCEDDLVEKVKGLQKKYNKLNEQWKARCAYLDAQDKKQTLDMEAVMTSGRTTRRSAATLGDLVRSDLEMEQIIASLGNDDATDPTFLSARNHATIPDMISVTEGRVPYVYDDDNLEVDDPLEHYRAHTGMDDWTPEERAIFLDEFAAHPKQFGIIADALPHKTTAQCVAFYYLHKKRTIDFRKVVAQYAPKRRRRRTGKQKANALLADIRQHDAEVFRDNEGSGKGKRRAPFRRPLIEDTPTDTPTPEPEGRPKRRRAAARSSLANEDIDQDDIDEPKPKRRRRKAKSATAVDDTAAAEVKVVDQPQGSQGSRRKPPLHVHQWSDDDKQLFIALFSQHGTDFKRIAAEMPTQTTARVTEYYKANCDILGLKDLMPELTRSTRSSRRGEAPTPTSPVMASLQQEDEHAQPTQMPYVPFSAQGAAHQYAMSIPGPMYGAPPAPYGYHPLYHPPFLHPLVTTGDLHPATSTSPSNAVQSSAS